MALVRLKDIVSSRFHDFKTDNNSKKFFKYSKAQKLSLH